MVDSIARILAAPGRIIDEDEMREFVDKEAAFQVAGFRDSRAQNRRTGAKLANHPWCCAAEAVITWAANRVGVPLQGCCW
ncbi:hypothetical protein [Streptomyces sp. NPDC102437]|uniref:hypothetical protein n=1 Tax=Streptomyces sp. NPDC102437 TaxID=3366175 RepID=UPI0037F49E4D